MGQSNQAELVELNAVVAVATHRNFRRAAAELGQSPSALSRSVASIESRLGVRLFHRTTRSVSLTDAGERFLESVRPALRQITAAMEAVNEFRRTPIGCLRITTPEAAAELLLGPIVLPFLTRYPDMQVDLVSEGRFVDIVAEGFDAGVRLRESVPRDMVAVPFGPPQRFVVVGSKAYFKKHDRPRTPADLLGHACIRTRMPSGALFGWTLEKRGEELVLDVKGPLTLGGHALALQAALSGVGLGYLNEPIVSPHIVAGRLVPVLEDWAPSFPGFCFYYPHRTVSAGLRAFVDFLRAGPVGARPSARR